MNSFHFHQWIFDTSVRCVLSYWTAFIFGKTIASLYFVLCRVRLPLVYIYIYPLEWCLHFCSSSSRSPALMYTNDIIIVFTIFAEQKAKKVHLLFRHMFIITQYVLVKIDYHTNMSISFVLLPFMFSGGLIWSSSSSSSSSLTEDKTCMYIYIYNEIANIYSNEIMKTKERERQSIQHERTSRIRNDDESTSSISEKVRERWRGKGEREHERNIKQIVFLLSFCVCGRRSKEKENTLIVFALGK